MFFLWYFIGSVKDVWLPVFFLSLVQKPAQSFFLIFWTDWCHSEEDQRSNCEGNKWVEKRAEIKLWTSCDLRWQMILAVQQTSSHHIPVLFHLLPRLSLPWVTGQLFFCWLLSVQTVSPITLLDWNMTLFISVTVLRLCYPLPLHCPGFYFPLCYEEAFQPQTTLFNNNKKKKNLSRWGEGRGSYPPLGQELGVHNFGLGIRRKKQDFMSG